MKINNILFVHSHVFYKYNNEFYSEGKLGYDAWKRYLDHANEVTVLARSREATFKEIEKYNISSGENVIHLTIPNISKLDRFVNLKETTRILRDKLLKSNLLIVRLPSEYGLLAIKEAKKLKIPYVIELVGDVYLAYKNHGNKLARLVAPLMAYKTKSAVKDSKYVLYVTNKYLQKKYPSKNLQITTSCSNVMINPDIFQTISQRKEHSYFTIGLIGSYNAKYKGIEDAFKALKKLKDEGLTCNLRILGSGNRKSLERFAIELGIRDRIFFDGSLPMGKSVWNWIKDLDLYIQPSHTEGLPRALIEAMACRVPCIGSNVGGIPELLSKEDMHEPKNIDALANLIKKFYLNEEVRISKINRNLIIASEYINVKLEQKRYNFFSKVISEIERK